MEGKNIGINKKVVIQFIASLADGGAETLVKDYALLLDKTKFDVKIVTTFPALNTANKRRLQENNILLLSIYHKRNFWTRLLNKFFKKILIPFRLYMILRKERADILHVHLSLLRYVEKIGKFIPNVKVFYTCHSLPENYFQGKNEKELIAAKKLIVQNNLQLIALHHNMKSELDGMFGINKTIIIRNGINIECFQNIKETKVQIRRALGLSEDSFVIGHVGRFSKEKNHLFLIDVFREITLIKKDAFLLLIGAGRLEEDVRTQLDFYGLNGRYLILSHRSDIPQLLKAMDVFVFPSLYEGLGIALVEAQAAGLRCVVSDSVPQEALLTEDAISISLNAPVENWCNAILDSNLKNEKHGNLENYDMNREIKYLERMYLGESDE